MSHGYSARQENKKVAQKYMYDHRIFISITIIHKIYLFSFRCIKTALNVLQTSSIINFLHVNGAPSSFHQTLIETIP